MNSTWTLAEAARSLTGAGAEPEHINRWVEYIRRYYDVLAIAPKWNRDEGGKAQDAYHLPLAARRVNRQHFQRWADAMGLPSGPSRKHAAAKEPPSPHTLRISVSTGAERWTIDEATELTTGAYWPAFEPAAVGYITSLERLGHRPNIGFGCLTAPEPDEWALLEEIWAGLPPLEMPIAVADWKAYEDAFKSSPRIPQWWTLRPVVCEPATALALHRTDTKRKHLNRLLAEIATGRIAAFHPQRGTRARPGDARIASTYLVRLDGIARLCSVLGMDVVTPEERTHLPSIRDDARPDAMPTELKALKDADLVLREPGYGPERRPFICTVRDFRSDVENRIQRQKEKGQFTFDEAVQILAHAHPEKDAERFATLLREARHEGDELKALDGADRLPLAKGETFLEDFDLLTVEKLNALFKTMLVDGFPTESAAFGSVTDAAPQLQAQALATRRELIDAFGAFTGMNMKWFDNVTHKPALFKARKVTGKGARSSTTEPLFCPWEVLVWLLDKKRKTGRRLHNPDKLWERLEKHFPAAHAKHTKDDPREYRPG